MAITLELVMFIFGSLLIVSAVIGRLINLQFKAIDLELWQRYVLGIIGVFLWAIVLLPPLILLVLPTTASPTTTLAPTTTTSSITTTSTTSTTTESTTTSTTTPSLEVYMVYSDIDIAAGDVQVWSGADWGLEPPRWVNGSYATADAPEGTTSFAVTSGSGHDNYVGWGVFLGIFDKNHKLITPHIVNLSDYKNLEFWVKTPINLKVEIQQDNPEGKKSSSRLISNYGWNSSLPDVWQKVAIPKSAFRDVDLTKIFSPFMITGKGSRITFYVDAAMWVP